MATMTIIEGNSNDKDNTRVFFVKGEKGDTGVSPTVEITKNGITTTITITDINGTHTATIEDGEITRTEFETAVTDVEHNKIFLHIYGTDSSGNVDMTKSGNGYIELWKRGGLVHCNLLVSQIPTIGKTLYLYDTDDTAFVLPDQYKTQIAQYTMVYASFQEGSTSTQGLASIKLSGTQYNRVFMYTLDNGSNPFQTTTSVQFNADFFYPAFNEWKVV